MFSPLDAKIILLIYFLYTSSLSGLGISIDKLKFLLIYSLSYGQSNVAILVFKAVKPNSLETSLKKNFLLISIASIGSYIIEVLPEPETPTASKDSNLLISGILTFSPVSESVQTFISHEYTP